MYHLHHFYNIYLPIYSGKEVQITVYIPESTPILCLTLRATVMSSARIWEEDACYRALLVVFSHDWVQKGIPGLTRLSACILECAKWCHKRRHSGHPSMHCVSLLPSVKSNMFDQHHRHRVSCLLNTACKAYNPMQKISWFPIFYTIFSSHLSI